MMQDAERLIGEAYTARRKGRLEEGLQKYEVAAEVLRGVGAPLRLAHTMRHVADIQRELGDLQAARANYTEALAIYRGDAGTGKLDLGNTIRGYALLMEDTGNAAAAREMWVEARELYGDAGVLTGVDEATRRIRQLNQIIT